MVNRKKFPRQIILNLTEQQYQQLSEKSKVNGVSYSEFLRNLIIFAPQSTESIIPILKNYMYETHKLGVNVNQIARYANSNFFSDKERNEFKAYLEKFNSDKKELIDFLFKMVNILGSK